MKSSFRNASGAGRPADGRRVTIMLATHAPGEERDTERVRPGEGDEGWDMSEGVEERSGLLKNYPDNQHVVFQMGSDSYEDVGEKKPSPRNPLVKTLSTGAAAAKKFTVINYGPVDTGHPRRGSGHSEHGGGEPKKKHSERRGSLREWLVSNNIDRRRSLSNADRKDEGPAPERPQDGPRQGPATPHPSKSLSGFLHPDELPRQGSAPALQYEEGSHPSLAVVSDLDLRMPTPDLDPEGGGLHHSDQSVPTATTQRASLTPAASEYDRGEHGITDLNANLSKKKSGLELALPMPMLNIGDWACGEDAPDGKDTQKSWHGVFPLIDVARRGRLFARRKRARLMDKDGTCNVHYLNLRRKGSLILRDLFTTLLNLKWRYNILMFVLGYWLSWTVFALVWWVVVVVSHDEETGTNPCVIGVDSFATALLFSIETQVTIGYGTRAITELCTGGIILVMIQSIIGVFIACVFTGIIFAKVARPKKRAGAFIFSKNAVVSQIDGELCLVFRVGDQRMSQMIGVTLNALLVCTKITDEGEVVNMHQTPLKTSTISNDQFYFLAWPVKVVHKIDEHSPLYTLSAEELILQEFEIIVILDATCETTGMTTQVRTSYLPSEILWGYRLTPLGVTKTRSGHYMIDFRHFHETLPVETPETSARERAETKHGRGGKRAWVTPRLSIEDELQSFRFT